MKQVKFVLFSLLVLCFGTVSNANTIPTKKPEVVQIQDILKNVNFKNYIGSDTRINVSFLINSRNEILVLTTNHSDLDDVIKAALNYKKLSVNTLEYNKIYTIPVVIK